MKSEVLLPVFTGLLGTLLLASCSSETDVNKENFTNAINSALHKRKLCFEDIEFTFPKSISAKEKHGKKLISKYDALHAAGLVSRKIEVKKIDRPDLTISIEKAVRYELTTTGYNFANKINKDKTEYFQFCFAKPHVSGIKEYTPPQQIKGKTKTDVIYLYSVTNVAAWARKKKLLDTFPQVKREIDTLTKPIDQKATLVLTKDRWVYEK